MMNGADRYNLAVFALRKAIRMIEAYDDDPDGDAGDTLEDIHALCDDTLMHLGVAATQEP